MKKGTYVTVCQGEAQINLHPDGSVTLSGPASYHRDEAKLVKLCRDGLAEKIARLREQIEACTTVRTAMDAKWPVVEEAHGKK